jgi:4,5-dihydroxyphthalate decarboxylase
LQLTLACGPYDRTQALRDGSVKPDGIELTYLAQQPAEIFWRMLQYQEFEVAELSMSNYLSTVAGVDSPFIAIPVFPSRMFRHSFIFVNTEKGIAEPKDLAGKIAGVPEYSMTAAVWIRGMLEDEYGIAPSTIRWVQGRPPRVPVHPEGVAITQAPAGHELTDMLDSGEIDFLVTSDNPLCFRRGSPRVRRLFPNYKELEQAYFRRTNIYPIMHTVVIRRDVYQAHPWVALSLYEAFAAAKERCFELLHATGSCKASLAWLQADLEEEQALFGPDPWPYGVDSNRPTLEALVSYVHEQGLTKGLLKVDELFAPSTLREVPLGEPEFPR